MRRLKLLGGALVVANLQIGVGQRRATIGVGPVGQFARPTCQLDRLRAVAEAVVGTSGVYPGEISCRGRLPRRELNRLLQELDRLGAVAAGRQKQRRLVQRLGPFLVVGDRSMKQRNRLADAILAGQRTREFPRNLPKLLGTGHCQHLAELRFGLGKPVVVHERIAQALA